MRFITLVKAYADGAIKIFDRDGMTNFLRSNPDIVFELSISKKRSKKQNRVYWMYVNTLSECTGFSSEEMHEVLKFKFLKSELVNVNTGEILEFVKSTTELSTSEFTEFIDKIRLWSIEKLNVNLPLPNEQINLFHE